MTLSPDFFEWIAQHEGEDASRLRLKYGKERADEILQIECRRKYAAKLEHTLHDNPEFVFPSALAGEQASSDRMARWHATLVKPGWRVADLTAGLGIDAMALVHRVGAEGHVVAVERDEAKADALRHNAEKITNIEVVNSDCRTLLDVWAREGLKLDCIFIDPARRDADGGRVFALDGCEPDVPDMLPLLRKVTRRLVIKASPMLDISHTVGVLEDVSLVAVTGTPTECKELVVVCDFDHSPAQPRIEAVTLGKGVDSRFTFTRAEEAAATTEYGEPKPGDIIYDPYPAVMKAAPLRLLGERYGLKKLAANTHIWFADHEAEGFPGRAYRVEEVLPYMSKHIKRYASAHPRVSVTARNFDITAEALRAKLRVADGPARLFAGTAFNTRKLLITCAPL